MLKTRKTVVSSVKDCRAKDPKTCPYHGAVLRMEDAERRGDFNAYEAARKDLEAAAPDSGEALFNSYNDVPPQGVPAIDAALNYDPYNVNPNLSKPKWWKNFVKESASVDHPEFGSQPELVDVIDSPVGPLAVVWQPRSQEKNDTNQRDSGYEVAVTYFKSLKTGETLGYIKTAWMSERAMEQSFGTDEYAEFRYYSRYGGGYYKDIDFDGYGKFEDGDVRPENTTEFDRQVWASHCRNINKSVTRPDGTRVPYYNVTASDAPNDEQVKEDLNNWRKEIRKDMDKDLKFFSSKNPFVDFSRIGDDFNDKDVLRGKGFGTSLYIYTAKNLAAKNNGVLRASGLQTEQAQAVWDRFEKTMPSHIKEIKLHYRRDEQPTSHKVLDFRRK